MSSARTPIASRLRQRLLSFFPRRLKNLVKNRLYWAHVNYLRRRGRLGRRDLSRFLRRLGLRTGDVVCVHSSLDAFRGFVNLPPLEIVKVLQETVGREGTLLMPTLPFSGSVVEYVRNRPVFDVTKTPSKMGLLTELFRRLPEVHRSVHPTHSAAAWGAHAEALVADHHLAQTPCGVPSPYARLLDYDGRILFLGVGILSMTLFHVADELLEDRLPFPAFTRETFELASLDADGQRLETRTRLYDFTVAAERDAFETRLEPLLKRRGQWREMRLGTLRAVLLGADQVLEGIRSLVEEP